MWEYGGSLSCGLKSVSFIYFILKLARCRATLRESVDGWTVCPHMLGQMCSMGFWVHDREGPSAAFGSSAVLYVTNTMGVSGHFVC